MDDVDVWPAVKEIRAIEVVFATTPIAHEIAILVKIALYLGDVMDLMHKVWTRL